MEQYLTTPVLVTVGILATVLIIGAFILVAKLVISKSITQLKYKDFEIDFTNVNDVRENGEGQGVEKLRALLLKELLFTQEFVNRFQPLISTFISINKKWDECAIELVNEDPKYPSLKYIDESLERFRDLIRNSHFNYVINWDCPIYDKVDSGYRDYFIRNIGYKSKLVNTFTPNLIDDCNKQTPTIDMKETPILASYSETKDKLERILNDIKVLMNSKDNNENLEELDSVDKLDKTRIIDHLDSCIDKLQKYISRLHDKEDMMSLRYDYAMDIANSMYESLLYWNEKSPRIMQSETSTLLYVIYKELSLWLIRNDLPLSQIKLEQYLNTHSQNLVSKINEEVIKQLPRFNQKMWEQSLKEMNISDININNYFRNNIRDWIVGVQQVRFGVDIFLGTDDYNG